MALLAASIMEGNLLPALMVVLAMIIGMWTLRRAQQRAGKRQKSPREQMNRLREATAARQSIEGLMVDLESFTRKLNAQLDTKFARLETTIRDADRRIAELKRLQGEPADDPVDHAPTKPQAPAPQAKSPSAPRPRRAAAPSAPPAEPLPIPPSDEPRAREVCELADAGRSPIQISEQLGLTLGEVELILQLRHAG